MGVAKLSERALKGSQEKEMKFVSSALTHPDDWRSQMFDDVDDDDDIGNIRYLLT